jgi:uncharacterized protein (TIGR03382 family)
MSALRLLAALVVAAALGAPAPARAFGAELHAYINWAARRDAAAAGVEWQGLDLRAYLAGSPAPDLWYAAPNTPGAVPSGIEEDMEYVRLLFAGSRNVKQLSFAAGYLGHIYGDGPGHTIYISPNGDSGNHLVRDASLGFALVGAYEGYPWLEVPLDLVLGWGLDVTRGAGEGPGEWSWGSLDDELTDLMLRTADAWCATRTLTGCPVSAATLQELRDTMVGTINAGARGLTFPGVYAETSTAPELAVIVRDTDDREFGPGNGPALLQQGVSASIDKVRTELFADAVREMVVAAEADDAEKSRLYEGPPPDGQDEREHPSAGGCQTAPGASPGGAFVLALVALWRRRR